MENFIISKTNPNDSTGGKGCLCSPRETKDCLPPFVVFQGDDLLDRHSPFPVACRNCISQALVEMENVAEIQTVGYLGDNPRGQVMPEQIDVVQKVIDENWLPLAEEMKAIPAGIGTVIPSGPEAKTQTVEEHVEERSVKVPSL